MDLNTLIGIIILITIVVVIGLLYWRSLYEKYEYSFLISYCYDGRVRMRKGKRYSKWHSGIGTHSGTFWALKDGRAGIEGDEMIVGDIEGG